MKQTVILILALFILGSCSPEGTEKNANKPLIVTTTGMIADLVKNIGRDSVDVLALMGPGVDPHLYKATQGDLGRLQQADLILYNGLHLEGKMGEVFEKLEQTKNVVPLSRAIPEAKLLSDPVYKDAHDPHIWFDVSLWLSTLPEVVQELSSLDPESADYYQNNAAAYRSELLELHNWVQTQISSIPKGQRILITAHDAFNYFGEAYDIEVRGLQGISTLSEFGLKDRVDLVNFIIKNNVKAVFVETSVSEKNITSILEGCQKQGHEISIGGNLFSDAMGAADTPEGTYTGMVKANVNAIVNALK